MEDYGHLCFSYFYANIGEIESALRVIFHEEIQCGRFELYKHPLDLKEVQIGNAMMGGREAKIAVVFAPKTSPKHCVFVSRSADGWHTLVNRLNLELKVRCVSIVTTKGDLTYPVNSIRIYESGKEVRLVRVMLDGDRWVYFDKGVIQNFENSSYYSRRRIRDRFDRTIVLEYLKLIGIDIEAPIFWEAEGNAVYIRELRSVSEH